MNRTTEHVLQFFLAELGTDGSIDGSHRLARPRSTACKQQDVAASHRLACQSHSSPVSLAALVGETCEIGLVAAVHSLLGEVFAGHRSSRASLCPSSSRALSRST